MAPERSATGNDAVLCPLPAPRLWKGGEGGGGTRDVSLDDQTSRFALEGEHTQVRAQLLKQTLLMGLQYTSSSLEMQNKGQG